MDESYDSTVRSFSCSSQPRESQPLDLSYRLVFEDRGMTDTATLHLWNAGRRCDENSAATILPEISRMALPHKFCGTSNLQASNPSAAADISSCILISPPKNMMTVLFATNKSHRRLTMPINQSRMIHRPCSTRSIQALVTPQTDKSHKPPHPCRLPACGTARPHAHPPPLMSLRHGFVSKPHHQPTTAPAPTAAGEATGAGCLVCGLSPGFRFWIPLRCESPPA